MSKPLGTVWDLEPHTAKKHEILRRYFDAWLPIMASWNGRVVYIDGFAGPGKYSKGEDGSPIVVLKAARDHTHPMKAERLCRRLCRRGIAAGLFGYINGGGNGEPQVTTDLPRPIVAIRFFTFSVSPSGV